MMLKPKILDLKLGELSPWGLGPDGKLKIETEDKRRRRLESSRRLLREIAEIPSDPGDAPDEEWMRAIDEMRPHPPVFKYWLRSLEVDSKLDGVDAQRGKREPRLPRMHN